MPQPQGVPWQVFCWVPEQDSLGCTRQQQGLQAACRFALLALSCVGLKGHSMQRAVSRACSPRRGLFVEYTPARHYGHLSCQLALTAQNLTDPRTEGPAQLITREHLTSTSVCSQSAGPFPERCPSRQDRHEGLCPTLPWSPATPRQEFLLKCLRAAKRI